MSQSSQAASPLANQVALLRNQMAAQAQQMAALRQSLANAQAQAQGAAIPLYPNKLILPFTYSVVVGPAGNQIAAGGNQQGNIQMAADSAFELLRMMVITSADVPTNYFQNNCSVQLQDQSSGNLMSSGFIPQSCYLTNAYQFGNDEKYPIQFPAQAILICSVNNLTGAGLTVTICLKGYKIFQVKPTG